MDGQLSSTSVPTRHMIPQFAGKGDVEMYGSGTFGGYTRWAVVFLIIFVLFFLLVPGYGGAAVAAC